MNGEDILRIEKDLDLITSTLRRMAWPMIGRRTSDPVCARKVVPPDHMARDTAGP